MNLKAYFKTLPRGSRNKFAADLGIHPMHLNNLIRGIRNPSLPLAVAIQKLTRGKVTPTDLLCNENDKAVK